MILRSRVSPSTCLTTFEVTASRSLARLSCIKLRQFSSNPSLMFLNRSCKAAGSCSNCSFGSKAAFTTPHNSWPRTISTFTSKWFTAYCKEADAMVSKQFPATRITKMSPKPWSKIISVGTRESEQPSTATEGNCFEIKALRSKALFSGLFARPVQKRVLPFCSSAKTSWGDRLMAWSWAWSACARDSSMEKPSHLNTLSGTSSATGRGSCTTSLCGGKSCGVGTRRFATMEELEIHSQASLSCVEARGLHEEPSKTPEAAATPTAKLVAIAMC
mmetsp:Transcript_21847/g.75112  ORF Transcript_21847/g.75112 Transcript_21847/m.75112 type:complete len:274 (+) Transcript_21847:660-1481(+)